MIGGGPLGCELAQAFCRLGCEVTIANREPYFLPGEERDAAEILADALRRDGIDVRLDTAVKERRPARTARSTRALVTTTRTTTVAVDEILVGVGRVPNVDGLDLEAAGVDYDREHGVHVDDFLQTTNRAHLRRRRRGARAASSPTWPTPPRAS